MVALVRGVHGLQGAVRVEVLTDRPAERFAPGVRLFREGSPEPLTLVSASPVADGPGWWLRFRELPDRAAAETLRSRYLEAEVDARAELEDGEVWWHEVLGATVYDLAGASLGMVRDVYRTGGSEVFVVEGGPRGAFDLPAVRVFIREFAPREGRIVVDAEALDLAPAAGSEARAQANER